MKAALILALVLVITPAQAKPWMCVLWPKQCIEPTAAPEPAPPPAVVQPAAAKPHPKAKPLPRVIRPKYKPAPARARHAAVAMPSWWSCKKAREKVAGKSRSEIEALRAWGQAFGYTLSKEQEAVAKRCVGFK